MDPVMQAAWSNDVGDPATAVSLGIMLAGILVVTAAALLEHWTGRSNLVTRALDRWSR